MAISEVLSDARTIQAPVASNQAYEIGDLLWLDSGVAKPAALQADAASAAANQAAFGPVFLGVCLERRLAAQTQPPTILVGTDVVVDADCDSADFNLGEAVTVSRDSAVPANRNQQLAKTTVAAATIGQCIRDTGGATTKIRVRLKSRVLPN